MKYQSSNTKSIYELNISGKKRFSCPECSDSRSKSNQKDLQYYPDNNRGYCFHCNTTFFEYKPFDKKEYILPEWKNKTDLTDKAVKYFESRMINQKTLIKMKIYSDVEWMPQIGKETEVICFPFFVNEHMLQMYLFWFVGFILWFQNGTWKLSLARCSLATGGRSRPLTEKS